MKSIAIYSRKSKFTGKGDSCENQIQLCKEFSKNIYPNSQFIVYEDEGFSAKDTDRPHFQEMLIDAKNKKFNILICYRLDRVSRNVADFSILVDKLQKLNIDFISIKEQFDTSTPMGRAMMYISSVFAQLERETIAERIRDNMIELAKTGRWLGGQTPLGYNSEPIFYSDNNMKEKKMYKLIPDPAEKKIVDLIYKKYLETKSLSQTSKFLTENSIKTKLGKDIWHKKTIKTILNNPVYVKANKDIIDYMESININVIGITNNKNGILTYNKKCNIKKTRSTTNWIAAIAKHQGFISSADWLDVQNILKCNKKKAPRIGKTNTVLLSGILKCSLCGSNMKVIHSKNSTGKKIYYYKCTLKENTSGKRCNNTNIRYDIIEETIISNLEIWSKRTNNILPLLNNYNKGAVEIGDNIIKEMKQTISLKEKQIENLINKMSLDDTLTKYIPKEIKKLDSEILYLQEKLKIKLNAKINSNELNINLLVNSFNKISIIKSLPLVNKQQLLSNILDSVYWNGETKTVLINIYGVTSS